MGVISISDLHIPHHHLGAIRAVYDYIERRQPDKIFLNGDIIDFYTISRYDKNPTRILDLQKDIDMTKEVLAAIRAKAGGEAEMIYIKGNHEERLEKWLHAHPEVSQLDCLQLDKLLDFDKYKIRYGSGGNGKWEEWGKTVVTHGSIVRAKAGYSAHGQMAKWGRSGVSGHTHRLAYVCATSFDGVNIWVEQGCLCDLRPSYVEGVPDWQLGFATGDLHPTTHEAMWDIVNLKKEGQVS